MPRSRMIDNFSLLAHAHKVGFYHQPGTRKSGYAKCDENSLRVLNNTITSTSIMGILMLRDVRKGHAPDGEVQNN